MAPPHPQAGKDHYRDEDEPRTEGVAGELVKRTVNIPEYGDSKDEVDPAENRPRNASVHDICCVGGLGHDVTPFEPPEAAS